MNWHLAAAFVASFVLSLGVTPLMKRVAVRTGMMDQPAPRKIHHTPMPLLGGVAIYVAAAFALLSLVAGSKVFTEAVGILGGATLLLITGLLDDRGLLHSQVKLVVAMPLAAVILVASGVRITTFSPLLRILGPDAQGTILWEALNYALSILWVIAVTAAFSILDHMDGLCAGVSAIAAVFFLYFAVLGGQILVSALAVAVMGAALGFLVHNFSPARIFMGDAGAMFLGFMMAVLGLKIRPLYIKPQVSWMVPLFVLIAPIFDSALVTVSRLRRGKNPFTTPGKDHTAHRLARMGLGQKGAVLVMYALGAAGGILAVIVSRMPVPVARGLFVATVIAVMGGIFWFEKFHRSD